VEVKEVKLEFSGLFSCARARVRRCVLVFLLPLLPLIGKTAGQAGGGKSLLVEVKQVLVEVKCPGVEVKHASGVLPPPVVWGHGVLIQTFWGVGDW
jgi:hypothetical protein